MAELSFVNLGCGSHFHPDWINIDFVSTSPGVIAFNLLNGIPLENQSVEVVYHSHALEHFPKEKASDFIQDCYRILKPAGIIRIAIPDLQGIIEQYSRITNELGKNPNDEALWAQYDWILLELYDQTVRNFTGGAMAIHLRSQNLPGKDFIIDRCGDEVRRIINSSPRKPKSKDVNYTPFTLKEFFRLLRYSHRKERLIRMLLGKEYELLKIGRFRFGGEIHQWMYDRLSLRRLLEKNGFIDFEVKGAFESNIDNWDQYKLDGENGVVRKPDSLFVEAKKPA